MFVPGGYKGRAVVMLCLWDNRFQELPRSLTADFEKHQHDYNEAVEIFFQQQISREANNCCLRGF